MSIVNFTTNLLVENRKKKKKCPQKGKRVTSKNKKGPSQEIQTKHKNIYPQKRQLDTGDTWMSPKSQKKARGNKFFGRKVLFSNLEGNMHSLFLKLTIYKHFESQEPNLLEYIQL